MNRPGQVATMQFLMVLDVPRDHD